MENIAISGIGSLCVIGIMTWAVLNAIRTIHSMTEFGFGYVVIAILMIPIYVITASALVFSIQDYTHIHNNSVELP